MKHRFSLLSLAMLIGVGAFFSASAPAAADDKPTKLRRLAYVIGANDGGAERVKLRYAGTDAAKVAELLSDLGGVRAGDIVVRTPVSVKELNSGFDELLAKLKRARAPGTRVELIFYYSGHSDERGLLLGESRLDYKTLRDKISAMPADVNIAILDSCASGAFTRTKGGNREPAFLVDESSRVTGYAFISSSSADEVAQESDRISASFFTHYLISGLRGGADRNRDGRVSLNEAYQFAFEETVARTESTVGGAQHPAYNMHLAGTGDVIMTDLRATSASLIVAKSVLGRLFVRDDAGALVIELNKTARHPVELGLSPGDYAVTLKRDGKLYRARIKLTANRKSTLTTSAFEKASLEPATARGAAPGAVDGHAGVQPIDSADGYIEERFRLSFTPQLRLGGERAGKSRMQLSVNIFAGRGDALSGVEVGSLVNIIDDDMRGVQVAGLVNSVGGASRGVRIAGLGNYTGGHHRGVLISGVLNTTLGGGRGVSVAGVANYVDGNFRGTQVGGTANVTTGRIKGLQVAGVANIAGAVDGGQIGLINTATSVKGVQIGLINVAKEADNSIGLINLVGNGYRAAEAWSSDTAALSVGVKLGAKYSYTVLAAGIDDDKFQFGGGIGLHTPLGRAYIDLDAVAFSLFDHEFDSFNLDLLAKIRLAVGYELSDHIAVFAGPTATGALYFDQERLEDDMEVTPFSGREFTGDKVILDLTPGLFAGVRLSLF